ncbi:glycosyltransferase [Pochonia chlamydosporia 170]|uniref:Glycosyltransferase n=1 Tax=Pochonia chlamydosporia 170 TaxID=1380566 RepID=A0A179EX32_METCM|nr:glycosyltransferase [Pochonia chlamydosporia 170]OAQ57479.2 glycosyltransferase [Pochonia chlamydosporia 170]
MRKIPVKRFRRCVYPGISLFLFCVSLYGFLSYAILGRFERDDAVIRNHLLTRGELISPLNTPSNTNLSEHFDPGNAQVSERIPRIIHQTFSNNSVPENWAHAYYSCQEIHKVGNWTHIHWTDDTSRAFLKESYPWFLQVYDRYPYAIQRADAIRYFVLYHFGGIYLDLDIGCRRPPTPLLQFDAVFPKTKPYGVSNDMMATAKGHDFFKRLITTLESHSHRLGTKYPTVMFSTGPVFVSRQLSRYLKDKLPQQLIESHSSARDQCTVRIAPSEFYDSTEQSFFTHYPGSSWHSWDVWLIILLCRNRYKILVIVIFAVVLFRYQQRFTLKIRPLDNKQYYRC